MHAIVKAGLWSISVGFGIAIGVVIGLGVIWTMILLKVG